MLNENRSLLKYLILSLITCGIYSIYFMFLMTDDINTICEGDGEDSPNYIIVLLLSFVTCGIYHWFWIYKQANRLYYAGEEYGVSVNETGTTILLWVLLGSLLCGLGSLYAWYLMFDNLNRLARAYNERYHMGPDISY